jgi:conjugative transposon protein traF
MASWEINKGVGRTVEFKGLKAQYLFLFAGGLLATFIVVVVLYLLGVSQLLCLGIGVLGASLLVWQTFAMNRKYGEHGLMKRGALRSHPRYLANRRSVLHLFHQLKSSRR